MNGLKIRFRFNKIRLKFFGIYELHTIFMTYNKSIEKRIYFQMIH